MLPSRLGDSLCPMPMRAEILLGQRGGKGACSAEGDNTEGDDGAFTQFSLP